MRSCSGVSHLRKAASSNSHKRAGEQRPLLRISASPQQPGGSSPLSIRRRGLLCTHQLTLAAPGAPLKLGLHGTKKFHKNTEFLLLGFSEDPDLLPLVFGLFLSVYLVTVLGNLLTISDSHLHMPMYFFLSNLSFVDICFTSTTIPKMLANIQTQSKAITYAGCITQMSFFKLFMRLENFFLAMMTYDDFVAICHPLHYSVIRNPRFYGYLPTAPSGPLADILPFYSKIVSSIRAVSSAQGKYRPFSTCASHLFVVSLFYCTLLGVYLSSSIAQNAHSSSTASVMYNVVTPMLNPFIYSLRNKDIKSALR
ncbi:olfactory receptor 7A17-like [Callospermophilus lateralis]